MRRLIHGILVCLAVLLLSGIALAADAPKLSLPEQHITVCKDESCYVTWHQTHVAHPKETVLTWESDDPGVATVDNGKVTGVSDGTATITCTATFEDGSIQAAACTVEVFTPVKHLVTSGYAMCVTLDGQAAASVTVMPVTATYQTLTWSSSDESVATVDDNGVVSGHKLGECRITAVATDGSNQKASIVVTVEPYVMMDINVTRYSCSESSTSVSFKMTSLTKRATLRGFGIKIVYLDKDKNIIYASTERCYESDTLVKPGKVRRLETNAKVISPSYVAAMYTEYIMPDGTMRKVELEHQLPMIYSLHTGHTLTEEETRAFMEEQDLTGEPLDTHMRVLDQY